MSQSVPPAKRAAVIVAIVCLVFGFPVLIVLASVLDGSAGNVVQGLLGLLVAVTFAVWLYTLVAKRNAAQAQAEADGADPS